PALDAPEVPVASVPEPASSTPEGSEAPEGRDAPDLSPPDLGGPRPDVPGERDWDAGDRVDAPPTIPSPRPSPPAAHDVRAAVAGVLAGGIYWAGAQRVAVVIAASDLAAGRAIAGSDLETRDLPPVALPSGAIRDARLAVGLTPRGPIWKGQLLVADALAAAPAEFASGVAIPTGYHAVALPVDA